MYNHTLQKTIQVAHHMFYITSLSQNQRIIKIGRLCRNKEKPNPGAGDYKVGSRYIMIKKRNSRP